MLAVHHTARNTLNRIRLVYGVTRLSSRGPTVKNSRRPDSCFGEDKRLKVPRSRPRDTRRKRTGK